MIEILLKNSCLSAKNFLELGEVKSI